MSYRLLTRAVRNNESHLQNRDRKGVAYFIK